MTDRRENYIAAREKLRDAVDAAHGHEKEPVFELTRGAALALLAGHAPDPEMPKSACRFAAKFIPFLAPLLGQHPDLSSINVRGITVTPHPEGGVILAATNGHVMLLARDPGGWASEGGVRLLMPPGAILACNPPPLPAFADQGDTFYAELPEWMIPGDVSSMGASLLVMPKAQPPDPGRHEEDGVALWSSMIETGHCWREDDSRRLDPVKWWVATQQDRLQPCERRLTLGRSVLAHVSTAMAAVTDLGFWEVLNGGERVIVILPAWPKDGPEEPRHDLAIIVALAQNLQEVLSVPSWVHFQPPGPQPAPQGTPPDLTNG